MLIQDATTIGCKEGQKAKGRIVVNFVAYVGLMVGEGTEGDRRFVVL